MAQSKLQYIDVLRGIAILGVLLLHFTGDTLLMERLPQTLRYMVQQGGLGVTLFFVASAFTLFRSAHYRRELHATRNFFIRRIFRIVPMYYLGICYYLWQNGFGPQVFLDASLPNSADNVVGNLFFLQALNPYWLWLVPGSWSIATEMAFYLLVPVLVSHIHDLRGALRFVLAALVFRAALVLVLRAFPLIPEAQLWESYLYFFLPAQLPVFGIGILLFFVLEQALPARLPTLELAALTLFLLLQLGTGTVFLLPHHFLMAFAFFLLAITLRRLSWDHLPGRLLRHIGKVSFSMYVCHWALLYWAGKLGWIQLAPELSLGAALLGYAVRLVVILALATLVSTLTYRLVELPAIRLGERLVRRLDSPHEPNVPPIP
jgi:peptidoglycan/LPS O-acetylase OafA/YrhL